MMIFPLGGGTPEKSTYQKPFKTEIECRTAMAEKFKEWQTIYETSSHVGIIGKCVER